MLQSVTGSVEPTRTDGSSCLPHARQNDDDAASAATRRIGFTLLASAGRFCYWPSTAVRFKTSPSQIKISISDILLLLLYYCYIIIIILLFFSPGRCQYGTYGPAGTAWPRPLPTYRESLPMLTALSLLNAGLLGTLAGHHAWPPVSQ